MERIEVGKLVFSPYIPHRPISRRKEAIGVTAMFGKKEWKFLDALWQCEGTMVTREYLWVYLYPDPRKRPNIRAVDVIAFRVRKKLAALLNGENCIHKVFGEGYKFHVPFYR
jgi:DNA-binding response OmpR family regulator